MYIHTQSFLAWHSIGYAYYNSQTFCFTWIHFFPNQNLAMDIGITEFYGIRVNNIIATNPMEFRYQRIQKTFS